MSLMSVRRVAVWIDRKEAKVFELHPETFTVVNIEAPQHHLTRKAEEQGPHAGNKPFFDEVAKALLDAKEILLVGPSSAKLDFLRHLHGHDEGLAKRVIGIETLDHPTNNQLAAYLRDYFHGMDRMQGLVP